MRKKYLWVLQNYAPDQDVAGVFTTRSAAIELARQHWGIKLKMQRQSKRLYRLIDTNNLNDGVEGICYTVERFEPNQLYSCRAFETCKPESFDT